MARQTHPPPSSGPSPFRLPGRGGRRGYALRGNPSEGAGPSAPTAPHATPAAAEVKRLSGPARFWAGRGVRVAFTVAFLLSAIAHWMVAPWNLLPSGPSVDFKDPAGDLAIPVDLLGEEAPPPPEPAPPEPPTPVDPTPTPTEKSSPVVAKPDAGPKIKDAGPDGPEPLVQLEAGVVPTSDSDGGRIEDAGIGDAGADDDGGLVALADGGGPPGSNGPRDPESMFGLSKVVNAGPQNVVLGVNVAVIRKHPVGARIGPILQAIPQWHDFLRGAETPVDPIQATEWILIYGPSLIHTEKDAVLVRYNMPDEAVDATIAAIAKTYAKGGAFDAGVPGVKASLGKADQAERVFVRPQSKLLVIVPPSHAREAALTFKKQVPKGPSPKEAVRLVFHNPAGQVRGLALVDSLTELRLWVVPREDGGADVFAEGDCADATAANATAEQARRMLRDTNSIAVRLATHGLLNNAEVTVDGAKVKLHVLANEDQLETLLQLAAGRFNVQIAPRPGAAPATSGP